VGLTKCQNTSGRDDRDLERKSARGRETNAIWRTDEQRCCVVLPNVRPRSRSQGKRIRREDNDGGGLIRSQMRDDCFPFRKGKRGRLTWGSAEDVLIPPDGKRGRSVVKGKTQDRRGGHEGREIAEFSSSVRSGERPKGAAQTGRRKKRKI